MGTTMETARPWKSRPWSSRLAAVVGTRLGGIEGACGSGRSPDPYCWCSSASCSGCWWNREAEHRSSAAVRVHVSSCSLETGGRGRRLRGQPPIRGMSSDFCEIHRELSRLRGWRSDQLRSRCQQRGAVRSSSRSCVRSYQRWVADRRVAQEATRTGASRSCSRETLSYSDDFWSFVAPRNGSCLTDGSIFRSIFVRGCEAAGPLA